jgi:hypothetical protein
MTDTEIYDLITTCRIKSNTPWDVLVSRFSKQLVALSDRLTEEELYSLLDVALICYQKGYQEFGADREAATLLNRVKKVSHRRSQGTGCS